ncbi:MAG: hypothetical protein J1E62_05015 [Lachnospiraceae bacterium]|nr:hypothetical protein [Lachnospiraceae bacterium]
MKKFYRQFAAVMSAVLVLTGVTFPAVDTVEAAAKKSAKLSKKKLTVQVGKTKTLKLKNNKKKTKWKIVSGKKYIKLKSKKKNSVKIVGKKKGTAKVRVTIGKKKLTCKVTVKKKTTSSNSKDTVNTPKKSPKPQPAATNKPIVTKDEQTRLEDNIDVSWTLIRNTGILLKVTNNNKKLVHCVKIRYHVESSGTPISNSSVEVYEIPAGESRYAYNTWYLDSDVEHLVVYINTEKNNADDNREEDVEVDQRYEYTDVSGYLSYDEADVEEDKKNGKIVLKVKNSYSKAIDKVPVMIIYYDDYGNVVDVAQNSVPGGILANDTQEVWINQTPLGVDEQNYPYYAEYSDYTVIINAYKL